MSTFIARTLTAFAALAVLTACASTGANPPADPPANERRFSGVVQEVNIGCYADGMCFMRVDGKRVVFGMGWSRETWGQVAPREPIESYVGRTVEVFCQQRDDDCWLAGNKDYYIR